MANNNNKKVLNVPALRFPEFTEEWSRIILKDVIKVQCGYAFKSEMFQESGIPIVRISNLPQNEPFVNLNECVYYLEGNYSNFEIQKGELLIAMSGATIGKTAIYNNDRPAYLNQRIGCFKVKNKIHYPYLYSLVVSKTFKEQLATKLIAGAQPNISSSDIESIKVLIPNIDEQQKIATFLSMIDQRISTQNKIIKKLQSLIKGIVVSHYSTTAHTIKVRIRELGEAYSTMVMSKEQLTKNGNLCVFYGELFTLYGCVIDEVKSRTSLEKVSSTLSHGRDLLFPASTTVDAVSLIAPSALMQKGIILGGDMFGIKVSEAYNPIYLSYYFNYIANKRLAKYAKGTTIIHLHYNEIANVAIELPNIEEQDKIVSAILGYSAKLSIEETILEKLFDLKQYLLKQLFI